MEFIDDNFDKIHDALKSLDEKLGYSETRHEESRCRIFKGLFTGYNESDSGACIFWINNPFGKDFQKIDAGC